MYNETTRYAYGNDEGHTHAFTYYFVLTVTPYSQSHK